jgi:excisionase family DNA binding protein
MNSPVADRPEYVQVTSGDTFLDKLAELFVRKLEHIQSRHQRVLDSKEAARYLGIPESSINTLVAEKKVTPCRWDRRLRFDIRELDRFIEESKE